MPRRLKAILAADVVGYSALMGADEQSTLTALRKARAEVFTPAVTEHGGEIVKSMGDGWLVEFTSTFDAVSCAMKIQDHLADDSIIRLRMGVHLGDVTREDEDVFGDGVNVAARLEEQAEPGQILIPEAVHGTLDGRIRPSFEPAGELALKNIDRKIRAWHTGTRRQDNPPSMPQDVPSIAVLAFENMSPDPQHDFFGDGLAEDIIATLSGLSGLLVIARNSSFTYKGRAVDLREVGRELGVRYVLEGSVRAAGSRIRVTAQLIDTTNGTHAWAERYDRGLQDIFEIQDEITREIVTALQIKLTHGQERQLFLRGTDSIEAWSCALPALEMTLRMRPQDTREARGLLDRALGNDPDYASAYAMRAFTYVIDLHFGYAEDRGLALRKLAEDNERALALEPGLALGYLNKGMLETETGNAEEARRITARAAELAPGNALVRALLARLLVNQEDFEGAESNLRSAMRTNPFHPPFYFGILANALERQGHAAEAIDLLHTAVAKHPDYFAGHVRLASLLGLAGQTEEAQNHWQEALALNPQIDRQKLSEFYSAKDPAALARFIEGLEAAGMRQ